jgi:hypothetical protein
LKKTVVADVSRSRRREAVSRPAAISIDLQVHMSCGSSALKVKDNDWQLNARNEISDFRDAVV